MENDDKTKFEMEIEDFQEAFSDKKNCNIAIYGTGRMTATLLSAQTGFRFVGVCDRDETMVGTSIYGLPVLDREAVEKTANILIINTTESYWNTIYERIKEWSLPIYFRNGKLASDVWEEDYSKNTYWETSYQELEILVEKYEVVSFDIFDTLIMRKVMFPIDVFRLVANKLNLADIDFVEVRKRAASLLEIPHIGEIYDKIAELTGKNREEVEKWCQEEISVEKDLLVARKDIIALCLKTMRKKPVYLVSDMYFPKETLIDFLSVFGVEIDLDRVLVSCDVKMEKESGKLWKYFQNHILQGRKCLHIGDNYHIDYEKAMENGIDAYWIMNAYEMLQNSSIHAIAPHIKSLYSSIGTGLLCAELFHSPFALNASKGKVSLQDEKQAGYCLLGPLIDTFLRWLIDQSREEKFEQLLFFARDGYLLIPLYQYMQELIGLCDCPDAIYLEISRRAAWMISIQNLEDIYEMANLPYEGNFADFLKDRFEISVLKEDEALDNMIDIQGNQDQLHAMIKPYEKDIIKQCERAKTNYRKYMKECNITENFAIVDPLYYGTTQYLLGKFLNKRLTGFYMDADIGENSRFSRFSVMKACFHKEKKTDHSFINTYRMFMEACFTAPNGMFLGISDHGEKQYSHCMSNQKHFDIRYVLCDGIKQFMKNMSDIFTWCRMDWNTFDAEWADCEYGIFVSEGASVTESITKSFYNDNELFNKRESPVWG